MIHPAGYYGQKKPDFLVGQGKLDNLSTHRLGKLYETFSPDKANVLRDRFEFVYTPKHGSWLNVAEIELNVLTGQCLNRRIDDIEVVRKRSEGMAGIQKQQNRKDQLAIYY